VQLVEDHAPEPAEEVARIGVGKEQRHLLGRGQQDVGRAFDLALALMRRRIARAGLDSNAEIHLAHRRLDIPGDIDRQRLQRRDVEGVETAPAPPGFGQLDEARQKAGERLAGARRGDEKDGAPCPGALQELELVRPCSPAARREPLVKARRQERLRGLPRPPCRAARHFRHPAAWRTEIRASAIPARCGPAAAGSAAATSRARAPRRATQSRLRPRRRSRSPAAPLPR
jgi:hypothetical protein